jgi:hypothetical protein
MWNTTKNLQHNWLIKQTLMPKSLRLPQFNSDLRKLGRNSIRVRKRSVRNRTAPRNLHNR